MWKLFKNVATICDARLNVLCELKSRRTFTRIMEFWGAILGRFKNEDAKNQIYRSS